jgi:hypothetical protein
VQYVLALIFTHTDTELQLNLIHKKVVQEDLMMAGTSQNML